MGTIGIRILAAGALSGVEERHPYGMAEVATISSGPDYRTDVRHAHLFDSVLRAGYADSLVELALRFAISDGGPSTVLLGISDLDQLNLAAALVARGPLPSKAMDLIANAWKGMANEARRTRVP